MQLNLLHYSRITRFPLRTSRPATRERMEWNVHARTNIGARHTSRTIGVRSRYNYPAPTPEERP